ncbi:glycosyltransferase family 2 protein [Pedosphaera parvula]|nr:glycosyltransferase family 2 protein [Pedosphaera parvula]
MDTSVIICTRNRAGSLKETLESVKELRSMLGLQQEVLVVDNGSSDETQAVVKQTQFAEIKLRYVFESRPGLAVARNRGVKEARGRLLLFTDDDVRLPQNWIELMCSPILEGRADAVVGRVKLAPELERGWMTATHRSWLASTEGVDFGNPERLVGANMALNRAVFEKVPMFDEELGAGALGSGEETLFSLQLKEAGFRLGAVPASEVWHFFGEERLRRRSWLAACMQQGKSGAYLNHHWRHERLARARYRLYANLARYYFWRVVKWKECRRAEGIPLWELILLERVNRLQHYFVECKRPYNYEVRGLVKSGGAAVAS